MTVLTNKLNEVFGPGCWSKTVTGIEVGGVLKVPKRQLKVWLARQIHPALASPMSMPIVRPKPVAIPSAPTPMPFLMKKDAKAKVPKPEKVKALTCPVCNDTWEDCDCKHVWCPYCGFEPKSGTQRGLDMHVKAKHPEIDW